MFDDYNHKNTSTRVKVKFVQKRDEPMYPWEIANFLKRFNTVYYKYELLNSICSALNHGIPAEDIFIFDHSLPLNKRYTEMNLLAEPQAARLFYSIGMPIPLAPSAWVYEYHCFYRAFNTINSFLLKNHVKPLRLDHVSSIYEDLQFFGLEEAEKTIISTALTQAEKSHEAAVKRGEKKDAISRADLEKSLEKYQKYKTNVFSNLEIVKNLDEKKRIDILTLDEKDNRRLSRFLSSFFIHFETTTRPLVCVRVDNNKFRVLGRSLINKQEQTGLELKEIKKNSPLGALFEGGIAALQAIQQEKRAKEIHEIDKEIKQNELELAKAKLHGEKIKNLALELKIAKEFEDIAKNSDITAVTKLSPTSPLTLQILKTYGLQQSHAFSVLHEQGLYLEHDQTQIDINV